MGDKSGIERKAPAGASAGANLSGKGASAALSSDINASGVPKAGSSAPSLGLDTNNITPEGEATAKKTNLG